MFIKKFFEKSDRRSAIRAFTFSVAVFIVLIVFGITSYSKATVYRSKLSLISSRSLEDLSDNIKNINLDLQKCIYSNSDYQLTQISENLKGECESAKATLSFLPAYEINLENLSKYISQTGNYASALARKGDEKGLMSTEERKNLTTLKKNSDKIYENLQNLMSRIDEEKLSSDSVTRSLFSKEKSGYDVAVLDAFGDMEEGFDNYPTLIYDGPFSDHILNKNPSLTEGKTEITIYEAKKLATGYCGVSAEKISYSDEENGALPCYIFNISGGGRVTISKKGGYLVYMLMPKSVGEESVSTDDATATAKKRIMQLGYGETKESYYTEYNGVLTVNLAYSENDVIYYTDLIKVSVSLDDNSIQMIDARGYVMNHHDRPNFSENISLEKAQKNLSPALKVQKASVAVIPSIGGSEVPCYEFVCKGENNEDILVYINTENGREEQIQIIIHTNDGDLAM